MQIKTIRANLPEAQRNHTTTLFIQKANEFKSEITVSQEGKTVSAKSLLGVLSIGLGNGMEYEIHASGQDETAAVEELARLMENAASGG